MADRTPGAHPLIARLGLEPHPEGGWYRRTWVAERVLDPDLDRRTGSAILYLLVEGETLAWHRLTDAEELWLHHDGAPLVLSCSPDGQRTTEVVLGPDVDAGQQPQAVVPVGCWQSARSTGHHTLVSCTVSPEFRFEGFELAPPCWTPGGDQV